MTNCQSSFDHLRRLGLSSTIRYSRRCIQPVFPDSINRDVVANISFPLIRTTKTLNLSDECPLEIGELSCDDPIELPVPSPDPRSKGQYTHLVFGVATTYSRLRDSRSTITHWLADSGAILICLLTDNIQDLLGLNLSALEDEYASSGVALKLVYKHNEHHTTEQSHMLLVRDMLAAAPAAHWLGILDDDTFFPSLHAMATILAAHDHTKPKYLGQLTEHAQLLPQGILGAFGGAGIFLSLALAHELEPHLDECLSDRGGDMQIMDCVHAHSTARLTRVDGLWQADLIGDSAGFYESGRRVLSMHHWKSWNWLPVAEMAAVTRVCGDCFLERFVFGSGGDQNKPTTVLNNGYSINVYDGSMGLPDLSRTEQTWDDWDGKDAWKDYEWSLGPLRPKVDKSMKKSYWLAAAWEDGKTGALVQVYLHREGEDGGDDEVVALVWQSS
ncbi:family 31 glycosyltransferase [Cryphonectria parasitica EP155]|uniref:Family 31 glycosyltransferase n=1 Tax=Cryphonectria parasitica (strain ATCC 38755 / EP155) TaxID=660469 RepID=A0A9P5CNU6_CRYP1|nr:family 31 glycosyltransferase [Cryphonectria parasitica EP155]KAF3764496.1 family 31 glycosyltransferase [Cryphonectria parasitica EP155]